MKPRRSFYRFNGVRIEATPTRTTFFFGLLRWSWGWVGRRWLVAAWTNLSKGGLFSHLANLIQQCAHFLLNGRRLGNNEQARWQRSNFGLAAAVYGPSISLHAATD